MHLLEHYQNLYASAIEKFKTGNNDTDPLIKSPEDQRFGITLLLRPDEPTQKKIGEFLHKVIQIEPDQYYYPCQDFHVTVMSIISCYQGFDLNKVAISKYIDLIRECLLEIDQFDIHFNGITASPSCIMIQGFPLDQNLHKIRSALRSKFMSSDLEQSIDQRYAIQTAHSTVIRFQEKITQIEPFCNLLEEYRKFDFGTFRVQKLELVFNDWYQRKGLVKQLYEFVLDKN